jgi:hypothetical protein
MPSVPVVIPIETDELLYSWLIRMSEANGFSSFRSFINSYITHYQQVLTMFVGPTELFISGDTLQLKDYSKTDWPWYFDGEAKLKRHETVFPQECRRVYKMGSTLVQ